MTDDSFKTRPILSICKNLYYYIYLLLYLLLYIYIYSIFIQLLIKEIITHTPTIVHFQNCHLSFVIAMQNKLKNILRCLRFFVSLQMVRGEIRTNESISYYFALSQNAQETIWNKTRSKVIEMWGVRLWHLHSSQCSNAFAPIGVMHSYRLDGVPIPGHASA